MIRTAMTLAAAIVAVIAIVALDAPAAGQSGDEIGRIVARRLDDGRVESGWQSTGGARVLPRQRYLPTDTQIGRWLSSTPIEVKGTAIGRIDARLLGDGRIEFRFSPIVGDRILPELRFFPPSARAGIWLRSSEITVMITDDSMGDGAMLEGTDESDEREGEAQTGTETTTEPGSVAPVGATEEISGRIMIRRLSDGRTEFGWLPSGSDDPILPSDRHFPAGAQATDWLSTSSVSVAGVEIGRISMRRASDSRIEFGFTPTNGERILPDARYFPVSPQVDRWLRGTEITFGIAGRSQ